MFCFGRLANGRYQKYTCNTNLASKSYKYNTIFQITSTIRKYCFVRGVFGGEGGGTQQAPPPSMFFFKNICISSIFLNILFKFRHIYLYLNTWALTNHNFCTCPCLWLPKMFIGTCTTMHRNRKHKCCRFLDFRAPFKMSNVANVANLYYLPNMLQISVAFQNMLPWWK